MTTSKTETPRPDEHANDGVEAAARAATTHATRPVLQTLDLGLEDATGLVCAIDDPDCVLPAVVSMTGDEDDA